MTHSGLASTRQPQLELRPFDKARLREVAVKLRELYPTPNRIQLQVKVRPDFIDRLIESVTTGFKGDVGVVPRQFLRRFVDILDLAAEHPDFDPSAEMGFAAKEPNEDERRKLKGEPPYDAEPGDEKGYQATSLEF